MRAGQSSLHPFIHWEIGIHWSGPVEKAEISFGILEFAYPRLNWSRKPRFDLLRNI